MAKVTALKVQARNKNRVNVYLDGEFAFGLVKIEAVRLRLGQELSESAVAALKSADEAEMNYERVLNLLSHRPRSEAEVRRYLQKRDVPEAQQQAILERLKGAGLVDDTAFAGMWVENRAAFKPKAKRALKAELRAKGVSAKQIEAAVASVDEPAVARQLAEVRAARLRRQKLPGPEFKKKLGEFLARRGFDYDTIRDVVEAIMRESGGDTDDNLTESEI